MNDWTLDDIKDYGFEGFYKISELIDEWKLIPNERGVYLIIKSNNRVEYLEIGTGGHFKNRNPNVVIDILKANWVDKAIVINIGQAGGIIDGRWSNSTLRERLKKYLKFGQGKPVGHWGGQYIWQLKGSTDFVCCWKQLPNMIKDPKQEETELIAQFKAHYKARPFANLI